MALGGSAPKDPRDAKPAEPSPKVERPAQGAEQAASTGAGSAGADSADAWSACIETLRTQLASGKVGQSAVATAVVELQTAWEAGRFDARADAELAQEFELIERAFARVDLPAWYAAAMAAMARTWVGRGRFERVVETLQRCAEAVPGELSALPERTELLAGTLLHLGRPGAAQRAVELLGERLPAIEAAYRAAPDGDARIAEARLIFHGTRGELRAQLGLLDLAASDLAVEWRAARKLDSLDALFNALQRQTDLATFSGRAASALRRIRKYRPRFEVAGGSVNRQRVSELMVYEAYALLQVEAESHKESRELLRKALEMAQPKLRMAILVKLLDLAIRDGDLDAANEYDRQCAPLFGGAQVDGSQPGGADAATRGRGLRQLAEYTGLRGKLLLTRGAGQAELEKQLATHRAAVQGMFAEWSDVGIRRGGVGFLNQRFRVEAVGVWLDLIHRVGALNQSAPGTVHGEMLEVVLAAQAQHTLARARGARPVSLAEVRRSFLRPGRGVLVGLAASDAVHVFAIDQNRLVYVRGGASGRLGAGRLVERTAVAEREREDGRVEDLTESLIALRDELLPESIQELVAGWRGVTLSVDDSLARIPWEAVPWSADGAWLGELVAVDLLPSLPLGVAIHESVGESKPGAVRCAVFGTVAPSEELCKQLKIRPERLPDGAVRDAVGSYDEPEFILDAAASAERFFSRDWASTQVVQLIAHGYEDFDQELGVGLAVTDGGLLPIDRRWPDCSVTGVWIVSACKSAAARRRAGDGLSSTNLGGSLIWSGAQAVALSADDLPLLDHLEFLTFVHRQLARPGATLADAIRHGRARCAEAARGDFRARLRRARIRVYGAGQLSR